MIPYSTYNRGGNGITTWNVKGIDRSYQKHKLYSLETNKFYIQWMVAYEYIRENWTQGQEHVLPPGMADCYRSIKLSLRFAPQKYFW